MVGGCGHVGLPLAIAFAARGLHVAIHDIDDRAVKTGAGGDLPFREDGAQEPLHRALDGGKLTVATTRR